MLPHVHGIMTTTLDAHTAAAACAHSTVPGTGLIGGGSYGFVTGWAQARKVGHTKLKLNSALNASGRIGGRLGNGFAVFGSQLIFFSSYPSFPPSLALAFYHFSLFLSLLFSLSLSSSPREYDE
jgi:hypothetical protein